MATLALLAAAVLAAGGCGENETDEETEAPVETAHEVPELPRGWTVSRNHQGGFALGVPPGWKATRKGTETRLRSPDRLVVVTVKADRTNEALAADLEELSEATGVQLGNQFSAYELGETRSFGHRYDAYVATAEGTSKGVRQEVEVFVLRREKLATFTVIAQRNRGFGTEGYVPVTDRIVRSIRSRPVR